MNANPYKQASEMKFLSWAWKVKRDQVLTGIVGGLVFIFAGLYASGDGTLVGPSVVAFGVILGLGIGLAIPLSIYLDLREVDEDRDLLPMVHRRNPNKKRIILAGAAGSGKDFLKDAFENLGFSIDISYTTRPAREGEVDEIAYNFITTEQFNSYKDSELFFEHVEFNGAQYGTLKHSWDNSEIFIMTPSGIKMIPKEDREKCFIVFLDIDENIRRGRMNKRSDGGFDQVERRIAADKKDFENFIKECDMISTNPEFVAEAIIKEIVNNSY